MQTVYEIVVTQSNKVGIRPGCWQRVCYRDMADAIVQRLASEGVTAEVKECRE